MQHGSPSTKTDPNWLRVEYGDSDYEFYIWAYGQRYLIHSLDLSRKQDDYYPLYAADYAEHRDLSTYEITIGARWCPPAPPKPKRRMTDLGLRRPR